MNAQHLSAMQRGKRQADERRRCEHARAKTDFLVWLKEERVAYLRKAGAYDIYGHGSTAHLRACETWREVMRRMPKPPPDSAW